MFGAGHPCMRELRPELVIAALEQALRDKMRG